MGWRREFEDKHTVTCPLCKTEWIYSGRKPRQKWAVCDKCLTATCHYCKRVWVDRDSRSIGVRKRYNKPMACPLCRALQERTQAQSRLINLVKDLRINGATSAKFFRAGAKVAAPWVYKHAKNLSKMVDDFLEEDRLATEKILRLEWIDAVLSRDGSR